MATSSSMSRYAPKPSGVRDPKDSGKKNGIFWNAPRYLYFGGAAQSYSQAGTKKPDIGSASSGQNAVGPISDRGRGR